MDGYGLEPAAGRRGAAASPQADDRMRLWVRASPLAARQARHALRQLTLPRWAADDAELLVSELVTNIVLHAGLGAGAPIQILVAVSPARVEVDVRAGGRLWSIRQDPGAESGWGLYLLDRLASQWGTGIDRDWFELRPDRQGRA